MERYHVCDAACNHCEIMDLLPLLLDVEFTDNDVKVTPSSFMAEMQLSTEQRWVKLNKSLRKVKVLSELNLNTFRVMPDVIIFQNFKPGTIYSVPLTLTNLQEVSKPLKMVCEKSPFFTINYSTEAVSTKVAPGMASQFQVNFCAEDLKDYRHKITFLTEGESFDVPIYAISPRPLLDFPDVIKLPDAPVKIGSERTILVRNLGLVQAAFSLHTEAPFSVYPSNGILLPDDNMQLCIKFKPKTIGHFKKHLIVIYETGEKLSLKIQGTSENCDIYLETELVVFKDTYMGLKTHTNVTLHNNSKHVVHFKWKMYENYDIENEKSKKIIEGFELLKEQEKIRYRKLENFDIIDAEGHVNVYNRIHEDELKEYKSTEQFFYQHPNFEIIPPTGNLWPEGTFDFTLIFSPAHAKSLESVAYLEVTGLNTRLPLSMNGLGIGPYIELNMECLNANDIFLCSVHQYEIVVHNKGDIPGDVSYKAKQLFFGGEILCTPHQVHLEPGECKAFDVIFKSKQQGQFVEDIDFIIENSKEELKFIMKGNVVCPLLSFAVEEFDFGLTSVGFPVTKGINLINPSQVPISFDVIILNDGNVPSITYKDFAGMHLQSGLILSNPKEFDLNPKCGIVPPNTTLTVSLTLCANICRKNSTFMVVNMWDSNEHSISLPIKYDANVPKIVCTPLEINIRFCYVTYPYNRILTMKNESSIKGYFNVIPQNDVHNQNGITVVTSLQQGFIEPNGKVKIPLTITTDVLGQEKLPLYIMLYGTSQPKQYCTIICNGHGPVISIEPEQLNFGQTRLLNNHYRNIAVINDSPIPAQVTVKISDNSVFIVEPLKHSLGPLQTVDVTISTYLKNPGKYMAKMTFEIENAGTMQCSVTAYGFGSTILCQPQVEPEIHLGTLMTHQRFCAEIRFTNMGNRGHKMAWTRNKFLKQLKEDPSMMIDSVFCINPNYMELVTNQCIIASIEAFSKKPGFVEEDFYCHALIEKTNRKAIIMSFMITAMFVEPVIDMSKYGLEFRMDVSPENVSAKLIDDVTITNRSSLPIEINVHIDEPFYLLLGEHVERRNSTFLTLDDNESYCFIVEFDPSSNSRRCFKAKGNLKFDYCNHPNIDIITLIGEVNYPNVRLSPKEIDFKCLSTNCGNYFEVIVKNISPLPVYYKWEWLEEEFFIQDIEYIPISIPELHKTDSNFSMESSSIDFDIIDGEEKHQVVDFEKQEPEVLDRIEKYLAYLDLKGKEEEVMEEEDNHLLPYEIIFRRTITKPVDKYCYAQLQEPILPPLYRRELITMPERNMRIINMMQNILHPLVEMYDENNDDLEVIKSLPKENRKREIDEVLDIIPFQGILLPYECQIVSVGFFPKPNITVEAKALCHVYGGATEELNILGTCSDLSYSLDYDYVDFGRQVFCEVCTKSITLTNTGYFEFDFCASCEEAPDSLPPGYHLEAGWLAILPRQGFLTPGCCVKLSIQYFPGIAGEFKEKFQLEIGHLAPITITVHGYGVFSQIYLSLPRPDLVDECSYYWLYAAVASLTPDYLKSLSDIKNILHYDMIKVYEDDIPKLTRKALQHEDNWCIISHNDLYPSVMDIDLAIERMLAYIHIQNNPLILSEHTFKQKTMTIPQLVLPPYTVDFGVIIRDTIVHYTILLLNYGPTETYVRLVPVRNRNLEEAGLKIQFNNTKIQLGQTKELFLLFHPTRKMYPVIDVEINQCFHIEVKHGPRIPINIKAFVTVPSVDLDHEFIDFGKVRCGDCLKRSILLRNNGHTPSRWEARIDIPEHSKKQRSRLARLSNRKMFFLREFSGEIEANKVCLFDVYFEPQYDGTANWNLTIDVDQNPNEMTLDLIGFGMRPVLKIEQNRIEFDPCLPYPPSNELFFLIENPCEFPIEFYFSDFETVIDQELKIMSFLTKHYKVDALYIPRIEAGRRLPNAFYEFYEHLYQEVKGKLIRQKEQAIIANALQLEEEALLKTFSHSLSEMPGMKETQHSKTKQRSGLIKYKKNKKSTHSQLILSPDSHPNMSIIVSDPFLNMSHDEIEQLMLEHLGDMPSIEGHVSGSERQGFSNTSSDILRKDPIVAAFEEAKGPLLEKDPSSLREGVLLIFHGAPTTCHQQAANRAGLSLKIPVYSLDLLFYEALVCNFSLATMKVNELIDTAFNKVASEVDLMRAPGEDMIDTVQKKVALILSGKKKSKKKPPKESSTKGSKKGSKGSKKDSKSSKTSTKKSSSKTSKGTKSSKASKSSASPKRKKKKKGPETLMNIPQEIFFEILAQKLEYFPAGLIIESLTSEFLRRPMIALNGILNGISNITYIHFILLSYTYAEHEVFQENLKQINEKHTDETTRSKMQEILDMDPIQFDNISAEDMAIFRAHVLTPRKLDSLRRREALKLRLLEKKLGIKPAQKGQAGAGKIPKGLKKNPSADIKSSDSAKSKKSKSKSKLKSKSKSSGSSASKKSKKGGKKGKEKAPKKILTDEEFYLKCDFDDYQAIVDELLHTLENWDRKYKFLVMPFSKGKGKKSAKKSANKDLRRSTTGNRSKKDKRGSSRMTSSCNVSQVQLSTSIELTAEELLQRQQIGIPCWLLSRSQPDRPVIKMVEEFLIHTPELREALIRTEESLQEVIQESKELFTVLHQPTCNKISKRPSEIFSLCDAPIVSLPFTSELSLPQGASLDVILEASRKSLGSKSSSDSRAHKRKHSRKRSSKRSSSERKKSSMISFGMKSLIDLPECKLTPRLVVLPGEVVRFSVRFFPKECGEYRHFYKIRLFGWFTNYNVFVNGNCDIPRLDTRPEAMFHKTIDYRVRDNEFDYCVFVREINAFDFGSVLLCNADLERLLSSEAPFRLNNVSLLPCRTAFYYRNQSEIFKHSPDHISVKPKTEDQLLVSAKPTKKVPFEDNLLVCIKNNPKVDSIKLVCCGCKFEFDIEPKNIFFEKVTLERVERRIFTLYNLSQISVDWEFVNPENFLEHYTFSELDGNIKPCSTHEVLIDYMSSVAENIPKLPLQLNVYDESRRCKEVLYTNSLSLSAEAVDVIIERIEEIDFGEVKGKMEHKLKYTLMNRSKYSVEFMLSDVEVEFDPNFANNASIRKLFTVAPKKGVLIPNKSFNVTIKFFPKKRMRFFDVPIFTCILIDTFYQLEVAKFLIRASAKTYLARFEICPPEINFGYQLVKSDKAEELLITNNGKFDFSYSIKSLRKMLAEAEKLRKLKEQKGKKGKMGKKASKSSKKSVRNKGSSATKKSSKGSKSSKKSNGKSDSSKTSTKSSKKKQKPTKLEAGDFTIVSSTGIVEPEETVKIKVTSRPKKVESSDEVIVVFISECGFADRKGRHIPLHVTSCLPSVNFSNVDYLFKEGYIVDTYKDYVCPKNIGGHCVYVREEEKLMFKHVCINTSHDMRLTLENDGLIATQVISTILINTPNSAGTFTVVPNNIDIAAYSNDYVTITFTPTTINIISATLEVTYSAPPGQTSPKLIVQLCGEGCVPEVKLLKPKYFEVTNLYEISYSPTLIDHCVSKEISFENVGQIPCQVIVEIVDDTKYELFLMPCKDTIALLNMWDSEISQSLKHTNLVNLSPNQVANFELQYKPVYEERIDSFVKIYTVNNPFETYKIYVSGEGYKENITFEGLSTCYMQESSISSGESMMRLSTHYQLDFGQIYVNSLQKKCFKIINHSQTEIYKFQFPNFDQLVFIPAVGHLKPLASKEIIATFLTKEPVNFAQEIMECLIYRINYANPQEKPLSWDERQNFIIWEPEAKKDRSKSFQSIETYLSLDNEISCHTVSADSVKTIIERREPEIEVLPKSARSIGILITVISDYSIYNCDVNEIYIPDTFMLQTSKVSFTVTNMSTIPLDIYWNVEVDVKFPKRINSGVSNQSIHTPRMSQIINTILQNARTGTRNKRPAPLKGCEKFLPDEYNPPSTKASLFSSEGNMSNRSNDSWCDLDLIPFSVFPSTASIPPSASHAFEVIFHPKDVFHYSVRLKPDIHCLHPELKPLDILVKATSILPLYHFDIEPSNYLEERRIESKICGDPVDENTRVVEFEAVGMGIAAVRKFNIINPTGEMFSYKWESASENEPNISLFYCQTPHGIVEKGKAAEAIFSFIPRKPGSYETLYIFSIQKYDIQTKFLLAGEAREPRVYFEIPHITLKPTVLGIDVKQFVILKNDENLTLEYKIRKESLFSQGRQQAIKVTPMNGVLEPKGKQKLKVLFHPVKMGEFNFCVECMVERMKPTLQLDVIANCFEVQPYISYENLEGQKLRLMPDEDNVLELNKLIPFQKESIVFTITNNGATGFYFMWALKEDIWSEKIKIDFIDQEGYVKSNTEMTTEMMLTPLRKMTIKKLKIKLQIPYGPTYTILFSGSASNASFQFSFNEYDFGRCLVQKTHTDYYSTTLKFTNNDTSSLILEYNVKECDSLTVHFNAKEIQPKETEKIKIDFHPPEMAQYHTPVPFFINSKIHAITIHGEGVAVNVELQDQHDKLLDLGSLMVGKSVTKLVKLANKGHSPVEVIFDIRDRLPYFSRPAKILEPEYEIEQKKPKSKSTKIKTDVKGGKAKKKGGGSKDSKSKSSKSKSSKSKSSKSKSSKSSKSDKKGKGSSKSSKDSKKEKKEKRSPTPAEIPETPDEKQKRLVRAFISVTPKKFTKLMPNQQFEFYIRFSPTERMKTFTEKICYQIQDYIEPICIIRGSSVGAEYSLDKNEISFGSVILSCFSENKVILRNTGDIGSKFKWAIERNDSNFVISPIEGYISPDSNVIFTVRFEPKDIECQLRIKLRCQIEAIKNSLELTCTGNSINLPLPTQILKFACPVRQRDEKSITLNNPTGLAWVIHPRIEGEYFSSTTQILNIPGRSNAACNIIYSPLRMTLENSHEAFVFFPLPSGKGTLYKLVGTAKGPLVEDIITREIEYKHNYTEELKVTNWLKMRQQFQVISETTNTANVTPTNRILYKITGNKTIDVPANGTRDYNWSIFALKEGPLNFKVTFLNEKTNEYLFYEINLIIKKPSSFDLINLTTCVRMPITYMLKLENPIQTPVSYKITCPSNDLQFSNTIIVDPYTEKNLEILYNPLIPGTTTVPFEAICNELGVYPYTFELVAHSAIPEPSVHFKVALGQTTYQKVFLTSKSNTIAYFTPKFEDDTFYLSTSISALANERCSFDIYFEPNCIGTTQSTLTLTSPTAGEYVYPLIAICHLPKPQGPYIIKPGSNVPIMFKNPFTEAKQFYFNVEGNTFLLKSNSEIVKPKKECKIVVSMQPLKNLEIVVSSKYAITGKLVVCCNEPGLSHIKWTYYLQGDLS